MKICAYVQEKYAKANYRRECMDARQFVGLRVVIDCLERAGYLVEYAGIATVHKYDVVLVSLTSDCDWWSFIAERRRWAAGSYRVIVGGAGVLHISPFLKWFDAAILGRGENLIVPLVSGIEAGERLEDESIIYSDSFSCDRVYRLAQVVAPYSYQIKLSAKREFRENTIGCNHKCLFCGYTWQRRFISPFEYYKMQDSLFGNIANKERAMLDLNRDPDSIDFSHLRTTAIDGFSERLRVGVNKPITREILREFFTRMINSPVQPHQIKLYNICGYPTETEDDWYEFLDDLRRADEATDRKNKQWSIVLHSTPFRAMPATPMACAKMSMKNYRGVFGRTLGAGLKGGLIYQGKNVWAVESMGTDSLSTVILSAIAHRGEIDDADNIERLCATKKFWAAPSGVKELTLEKYFDIDRLFGEYTPETLPSRYLRTYAGIEKMWGKTPLEVCEWQDRTKK